MPDAAVTTEGGVKLSFRQLVRHLIEHTGEIPFAQVRFELAQILGHAPSRQELWSEYERRYPGPCSDAVTSVAGRIKNRRRAPPSRSDETVHQHPLSVADTLGEERSPPAVERTLRELTAPIDLDRLEKLAYPSIRRVPRRRAPKKRARST